MKNIALSIAAAAVSIAGSTALAAELPTYEVNGFPVSPVQVQLLGAGNAREQAASTITPSVLTPRRKTQTATTAPITTGAGR